MRQNAEFGAQTDIKFHQQKCAQLFSYIQGEVTPNFYFTALNQGSKIQVQFGPRT